MQCGPSMSKVYPGQVKFRKRKSQNYWNSPHYLSERMTKDELLGFVICLPPKTAYGSLNYAWFNEHYASFVYVDRIAVSEEHRNKGVGSALYNHVVSYSKQHGVPVAAEVNREPPNPGSMRFHHRFGFEEVGVLHHAEKSVTMFLKQA